MTANAVELLTRYPVRSRFDPTENRLTAAVAAALDQSPRLRAEVIGQLWAITGRDRLSSAGEIREPPTVTPQKPVFPAGRQPCFLDLELVAAASEIRVWIEAKVGSGLSGPDQLTKYADALEREPEKDKLLVLLAPAWRRRELEQHVAQAAALAKCAVVFASWADIHRTFVRWTPSSLAERRGHWLVREVSDYMEDQGQGSVSHLRKRHVDALRGFKEATNAVSTLFEKASATVDWPRARGAASTSRKSARWEDWGERSYRSHPGETEPASRSYRSFAFTYETPLKFGAGAYFRSLSNPMRVAVKHYAYERDDWVCGDLDSEWPWLWRYVDMTELLRLTDLEDQAATLGAFVLETFHDLHQTPPRPNAPVAVAAKGRKRRT